MSENGNRDQATSILKGHEEAPTETIAFVVKRANETKSRGNAALKTLQELQSKVEEVQAVVMGAQGALESYKADIIELLEKEND